MLSMTTYGMQSICYRIAERFHTYYVCRLLASLGLGSAVPLALMLRSSSAKGGEEGLYYAAFNSPLDRYAAAPSSWTVPALSSFTAFVFLHPVAASGGGIDPATAAAFAALYTVGAAAVWAASAPVVYWTLLWVRVVQRVGERMAASAPWAEKDHSPLDCPPSCRELVTKPMKHICGDLTQDHPKYCTVPHCACSNIVPCLRNPRCMMSRRTGAAIIWGLGPKQRAIEDVGSHQLKEHRSAGCFWGGVSLNSLPSGDIPPGELRCTCYSPLTHTFAPHIYVPRVENSGRRFFVACLSDGTVVGATALRMERPPPPPAEGDAAVPAVAAGKMPTGFKDLEEGQGELLRMTISSK